MCVGVCGTLGGGVGNLGGVGDLGGDRGLATHVVVEPYEARRKSSVRPFLLAELIAY